MTTSADWASQIITAWVNSEAQPASLPKLVITGNPLCNQDSYIGATSKNYPKYTDLGPAPALVEGVAPAPTVLTMGAAATATASEIGAFTQITDQAMSKVVPGTPMSTIDALFQAQNAAGVVSALGSQASRLLSMVLETPEAAATNIQANFATTAGASGVALSIATMIEALFAIKNNEVPSEDLVFCLSPKQTRDLQLELAAVGTGSAFFQQMDASVGNANLDPSRTGYRGSLLNIPIYEQSSSMVVPLNAGVDEGGSIFARGTGTPDSGRSGAILQVDYSEPSFRLDHDAPARAVNLVCTQLTTVIELNDWGVTIVSAA